MSEKNKSNEIKITRVYDAPVRLVWEAWADPKKAALWWGPRGFTITTHSKDLKAGGHWHYTMHGPDGTDYPNKTVYFEVEQYKRLVYDHGANDTQPALFRVTVDFKDLGKQTKMEMTMTFATPEVAAQSKKFIKLAGGNSTWDRLGEYVEKEISNTEVFITSRSFEAPIEDVFEMWVNPKHFAQWLGPIGSRMEYIDDDIGEGKTSFYKITSDAGVTMFGKMEYHKILEPIYLEYTQIFCDEKGQLSKNANVPLWPDSMLTRVLLAPEENNETRITVIWKPEGKFSQAELQAFKDMRAGMTQGWSQSFDKLDNLFIKSRE